jgi:hypothetical protein
VSEPNGDEPKVRAYLDVAHAVADPSNTPELAAAILAAQSRPEFQRLLAIQRRIAERGLPALVVVDDPLPSGVLAFIRLGHPGALGRFVVVSAVGLRDELLDRALGLVHRWETENVDDESPMAATLFVDGRYTATSERGGEQTGMLLHMRFGNKADSEIMSAELLARASAATPREIPGVGLARVVELS